MEIGAPTFFMWRKRPKRSQTDLQTAQTYFFLGFMILAPAASAGGYSARSADCRSGADSVVAAGLFFLEDARPRSITSLSSSSSSSSTASMPTGSAAGLSSTAFSSFLVGERKASR